MVQMSKASCPEFPHGCLELTASETLVTTQQFTRRGISKDWNVRHHLCKNL